MSSLAVMPRRSEIEYPEDDGNPMSDNTVQFRWIMTIQGGLDDLFRNDPDVFVAGDLLWYPVAGDNRTRQAPDTMVVFGRPKGDRGSYRQWDEDDIAPQVVFEVLSPGNRIGEMVRKCQFYDRFGVEEYYQYDPDRGELAAWIRQAGMLKELDNPVGSTSPRLGVRFELDGLDLRLIRPDGQPFATYLELAAQRDVERQRADSERQRADSEQQCADSERQRAEQERQRAERLVAQLRAAGMEPE